MLFRSIMIVQEVEVFPDFIKKDGERFYSITDLQKQAEELAKYNSTAMSKVTIVVENGKFKIQMRIK